MANITKLITATATAAAITATTATPKKCLCDRVSSIRAVLKIQSNIYAGVFFRTAISR